LNDPYELRLPGRFTISSGAGKQKAAGMSRRLCEKLKPANQRE